MAEPDQQGDQTDLPLHTFVADSAIGIDTLELNGPPGLYGELQDVSKAELRHIPAAVQDYLHHLSYLVARSAAVRPCDAEVGDL